MVTRFGCRPCCISRVTWLLVPYKVKGKCVYKKDTGEKVGCTRGSVKKYLAALHANVDETNEEDLIESKHIMKINKKRLVEIIKEEVEKDLLEEAYSPGITEPVSYVGRNEHPNDMNSRGINDLVDASDAHPKALFNNVQIVSRVIEEIPFHEIQNEFVKEGLLDVAEELRAVLDTLAEQLEFEEKGY